MWFGPTTRGYTANTTGQLVHNQPVSVTIGSGFGTKSRALSPLLRDTGTDGVGAISAQWDIKSPNNTGTYSPYNLLNQVTNFNPTGSLIGSPHSYVSAILGAATAIPFGSGDYQIFAGKKFTLPTLPCVLYASFYRRSNPDWSFGIGSPVDYNYKQYDYSNTNAAATGNNWYGSFSAGGPADNTVVSRQIVITDDSSIAIENPDGNGHNLFWGQSLNPMHAANGWVKSECEILITTATGLAGGGYHTYNENGGSPIINYAGRTDNWTGTTRYFYLGAYNRDYPSTNNWRCFADVYIDVTSTVTAPAHCARLMFGNAATLTACTILEPAIPTAWADNSITATFWKGNLPGGSTAFPYVFTEAGTVVVPSQSSFTVSNSP